MAEEQRVRYSSYKNRLSVGNRLLRLVWNIVAVLLFRPCITRFGNPWRLMLLRLFGATIGQNCSVSASTRVWAPWNLVMEDNSLLAEEVRCYNVAMVTIRSETVISECVWLCAATHDIDSPGHELQALPIEIQDQVWVAVDAFIGPGVTVGQGAVVGARAAVFTDVEPWVVVGGNPARVIRERGLRT